MKASLGLEAIGYNTAQMMSLWNTALDSMIGGLGDCVIGGVSNFRRWGVWEITGLGEVEISGRTDYSRSNSKGSRGVRIFYTLESGRRYRVRSPQSWKSADEYICHVTESGEIVRE